MKTAALDGNDAGVELFTSLRRTHLWSTAVEQIRTLIASGRLSIGTRLPGERELCLQLGISRVSLREAIRVLENMGHLEVKPGLGTFVRDPAILSREHLANWLRDHNDLVHQLFEVRELVEPGVAALAAKRRDPALTRALGETIDDMVDALQSGDISGGIAADATFHHILARATGNEIVDELMRQMIQILGDERRASLQIPGQVERAIVGHRQILAAVSGGDDSTAEAAMRRHLKDAVRYIDEWIAEQNRKPGQA